MEISIQLKKRFCKDCNIPISLFQEPYFTERLRMYDKYYGTLSKWDRFIKGLEVFDNEQEYFEEYNRVKDDAINFLKDNEFFKEFNEEDMSKYSVVNKEFPSKDIYRPQNNERVYISIDMVKANFTSLSHYNPGIFNHKKSWEEFIQEYTDNDHIINSKYIRQVIMGNCNPKRQCTYEKYLMDQLLSEIFSQLNLPKEKVVYFSNDEIVIDITEFTNLDRNNFLSGLVDVKNSQEFKIKIEVFKLHSLQGIEGYYKEIFYSSKEEDRKIEMKSLNHLMLPFVIRKLNGEEVSENDKVFIHEGYLSKFIEVPEIKILKKAETIEIPAGVQEVIDVLERHNFQAFVVGGCVRDVLLGRNPHDWDICTSAKPEEIKEVCNQYGYKTIDTGIKHGTVTVCLNNGEHYEVTTFRIDGEYSDGRHPDKVEFTSDLVDDLSRRDFTMNAMAFNKASGLYDPFNGEYSLQSYTIRCVGEGRERFKEDGLRILRALRFASTYGFSISTETAAAMHDSISMLDNISAERINSELSKLLLGSDPIYPFMNFHDEICAIIPEFKPCIGFDQKNKYHCYTVYEHIVRAVANYKGEILSVKLALLFHDIGKPQCFTEDENGGHFRGHAKASRDIAEVVLKRLKYDNKTIDEVLDLILYHDGVIEPDPRIIRRWLNRIGEDKFRMLMEVRIADIKAHVKSVQREELAKCRAVYKVIDDVLKEQQCFSLKDLAVNGNDIKDIGAEGKMVGDILDYLLDMVIDEKMPNEKEKLLDEARMCYYLRSSLEG